MKTYSKAEFEAKIKNQNSWEFKDDSISKDFKFENFIEAFSFLTKVAILAEKAAHHPEIKNVYNKVNLVLTTHDVNGLTDKDIDLAERINELK